MSEFIPLSQVFLFLAATETYRELSLLIGGSTFVGGLLAMFSHQREYKRTLHEPLKRSAILFEYRKYRRRIVVAGMISSLGMMIASLRWIVEPRQFASLILIILATLLAIFGIALIDMYSVGLQAYTRRKDPNRKELIEKYVQRKRAEHESQSSDDDHAES